MAQDRLIKFIEEIAEYFHNPPLEQSDFCKVFENTPDQLVRGLSNTGITDDVQLNTNIEFTSKSLKKFGSIQCFTDALFSPHVTLNEKTQGNLGCILLAAFHYFQNPTSVVLSQGSQAVLDDEKFWQALACFIQVNKSSTRSALDVDRAHCVFQKEYDRLFGELPEEQEKVGHLGESAHEVQGEQKRSEVGEQENFDQATASMELGGQGDYQKERFYTLSSEPFLVCMVMILAASYYTTPFVTLITAGTTLTLAMLGCILYAMHTDNTETSPIISTLLGGACLLGGYSFYGGLSLPLISVVATAAIMCMVGYNMDNASHSAGRYQLVSSEGSVVSDQVGDNLEGYDVNTSVSLEGGVAVELGVGQVREGIHNFYRDAVENDLPEKPVLEYDSNWKEESIHLCLDFPKYVNAAYMHRTLQTPTIVHLSTTDQARYIDTILSMENTRDRKNGPLLYIKLMQVCTKTADYKAESTDVQAALARLYTAIQDAEKSINSSEKSMAMQRMKNKFPEIERWKQAALEEGAATSSNMLRSEPTM